MKKLLLLIALFANSNLYGQKMNALYRMVKNPMYFSISCGMGSTPADNCMITYHHDKEFSNSTSNLRLSNIMNEVDENNMIVGKYNFNDDFTGYYTRNKPKMKENFRMVVEQDFEEIYSEEKIVRDLLGQKTNKWRFDSIEEFKDVVRISNTGMTRQLGIKLMDLKNYRMYYMVLEVKYKLLYEFQLQSTKQISYSEL